MWLKQTVPAPGHFGDLGGAKVDISKVLGEPKRWKDILSAGQGVGSIHDVVPTAVLNDQFEHEYNAAIDRVRSEEHTSELQSLMRSSYAVFCLKKKNT